MRGILKKYNKSKISNVTMSVVFILLFFTPTLNELYEVYAHNHSLQCTAKHENHLHKDHETFLYNITVVNDYVLTKAINIGIKFIYVIDISKSLYKSVELSKKLTVYHLRPPPVN